MDGATCTQPGCGGTIDGGFCNRCGLEPPNAGSAVMGTGALGLDGRHRLGHDRQFEIRVAIQRIAFRARVRRGAPGAARSPVRGSISDWDWWRCRNYRSLHQKA